MPSLDYDPAELGDLTCNDDTQMRESLKVVNCVNWPRAPKMRAKRQSVEDQMQYVYPFEQEKTPKESDLENVRGYVYGMQVIEDPPRGLHHLPLYLYQRENKPLMENAFEEETENKDLDQMEEEASLKIAKNYSEMYKNEPEKCEELVIEAEPSLSSFKFHNNYSYNYVEQSKSVAIQTENVDLKMEEHPSSPAKPEVTDADENLKSAFTKSVNLRNCLHRAVGHRRRHLRGRQHSPGSGSKRAAQRNIRLQLLH